MAPKRVVIVNAGGFGRLDASNGDYDGFIGLLSRFLDTLTQNAPVTGKEEKAVIVEVVTSVEEAEGRVNQGQVDCLIFITRGLLAEAKRIKMKHPHQGLKVIVFTSLMPENDLILLDKSWLSSEALKAVILS